MAVFHAIGQVLTLLGSLALFLFGMKQMSESLQRVAGSKMRNILNSMTSTRFKGVLTGFTITSVLQSSSATTVMIVSFVNAGLLTLTGSIGVIMGANIGTTVTAWLISLLGFKVSISALSLPLIGIFLPLMFSKRGKRKAWGEFVLGFAILFLGLRFLKDSVPDVQSNPEFFTFLADFSNLGYLSIFIFVMIGTLLTVIIQSSSATMALTLVLCYNGVIPFELAASMVLGENIGTTITANIAAIVANASAKRAARAHFLFNVFGVIWILIIFHPFLNAIDFFIEKSTGISVFGDISNPEVQGMITIALSIFHTAFNIINTFLLVWFTNLLAKIATLMVRDRGSDEEFRLRYIASGYMSTSELSTLQAKKEIVFMAERVKKMFTLVPKLLVEKQTKEYTKYLHKMEVYEDITDRMEIEIGNYITRITENDLSIEGSKRVSAMLKIVDELESVADTCFQMSKVIDSKNEKKVWFTQELRDTLNEMFSLVDVAIDNMNKNLSGDYHKIDFVAARNIEIQINKMRDKLKKANSKALKKEQYSFNTGTYYSDLISLSEKIGDYIDNINEAIAECK
ncbi:MAG: Na/Pi cotransporter family protein [Bacteroidales bacterium]|nr:Na/Pi cotransporter family protein [Bacteroidales bacterium]MDY0285197.1 Na/Pi cotransporter family protein [Bacteroidales bacterium]